MVHITIRVNTALSRIPLTLPVQFNRMRVVKALLNNQNLGNASSLILVRVGELSQHRFNRVDDNDLAYTFMLPCPQNNTIAYDKGYDAWDFIEPSGDKKVISILEIEVSDPGSNLSFAGGSFFVFELEFV